MAAYPVPYHRSAGERETPSPCVWACVQEGWTNRAGNRWALLPVEAVSWHDGSHSQAVPDPKTRWTARPRSCGVNLTCCTFLGPSLAATKAKPIGGADVQPLTVTPFKHFGPLRGLGGGRAVRGAAGMGSRVPHHTYLKMIPSSHCPF